MTEGHLVAGRYRLVSQIGTGAMGVVWQGHDERLNRPVAVKKLLLQPGLPPSEAAEAVARCLREGRIAARLHHPNAITVFDVVDEDGVPCLVMEYLQARSLATVLAEDGPLPPGEVAGIGAQVAAALAAAHDAGIVHRDITPGNILLGEDGSVKITDFGISRATDDVTVTKTGMIAGTPAYLAPEVALGGEPTPASDVFSLGSSLYAAVEGEPPFGLAANTLGLLHAVASGQINPPQRSGPLTDVLLALLGADPQARPTAAETGELLAAVGRGEVTGHAPLPVVAAVPVTSAAASGGEPVAEDIAVRTELVRELPVLAPVEPVAARRSRGPLAVAAVFVVALVAAGVWLLGSRDSLVPAEERVPASGTGHSQTTQTSESAPVAPVTAGEPAMVADETPVTSTRKPRTATPPTGGAPKPTRAVTTTPPPATTTTENAPEPTSSATTPPPPSSSEVPITAPSTATEADTDIEAG